MKKRHLLPLLFIFASCSNDNTTVHEVDLGQTTSDQEISSSSEEAIESSSSEEAATIESSSDALPESSAEQTESSSEAPESSAAETPESSSSERVVINFDSLPSFIDARDSQSYKYVTIGEQVWMAENLRFRKGFDSLGRINDWCFNNEDSLCAEYGALYSWSGAMNVHEKFKTERLWRKRPDAPVQGICPEGWHLPTTKDFGVLQKLSGNTNAYEKLRAPYGWENNTEGTNDIGFFAVGSGYMDWRTPTFTDSLNIAGFWAASDISNSTADVFAIIAGKTYHSPTKDKRNGYSVRCIKGEGEVIDSSNIYYKPFWNDMKERIDYGLLIDERDGHFYRTVKIGEQTWMAENLNHNGTYGGYCQGDKEENCDLYGRQYHFTQMLEISKPTATATSYQISFPAQGVCPKGWHVPDTTEWNTLIAFAKADRNAEFPSCLAAQKLFKGVAGKQDSVNFWGHDSYGFSVFPYYKSKDNSSEDFGTSAVFASSIQYTENTNAYHSYQLLAAPISEERDISFVAESRSIADLDAHVRCIKN
jgi:uncharacterized protein (TIGR02145 family)